MHAPGQRLSWLIERLVKLDKPYLITGAQAAFQYHRWLTPLENLASIQVHMIDMAEWLQLADDTCVVIETLPSTAQARMAQRLLVLEPTLESGRYLRRHMIDGLAFVAPEDLCLDLVARARGETSPAEAAAILIARHAVLDWRTLLTQAGQRGLARRLGALIEAISIELGTDLAPAWFVTELHLVAQTEPSDNQDYPARRSRTVQATYPSLTQRWGVRLRLPHHVIGKVVFDLGARSGTVIQPAGR